MQKAYQDYISIGLLSALFIGLFLGDTRGLSIPDEGRYVGIAVEMLRTNDWIVPRLNGVQYLYKPPLFYWLNTLSLMVFDNVIWASRFVPAFLSWCTVIMTLWFTRQFFNRTVANISAGFLGLSFIWYIGGRSVNLDLAVASFMVMGCYMYFMAYSEKNRTRQSVYAYAMYIFIALAVLTKGFVGAVLTGGIFFIHIITTKGWKTLLKLRLISGILLAVTIVLPWHILMYQANPEWFDFYIVREHFARFFTAVHNRYEPWWYFIPFLAIGLMPYGAYVVQPLLRWRCAWAEKNTGNSMRLFLLIWVWFILLFFSASASKLPLYILPIIPPICILSAQFMGEVIQGKHRRCVSISAFLYMIFVGALGLYVLYIAYNPTSIPEKDVRGVQTVIASISPLIIGVGIAFILHGLVHFILYKKHAPLYALVLAGVLYIPSAILINPIIGATNKKSTADIVQVLQSDYNGEEIILSQFYEDVPVFTNSVVSVVNYSGESQYFIHYEDLSNRYYNTAEFNNRWLSGTKKYMILHKYNHMDYIKHMPYTILAESHLYYLVTNQK